MMKHRRLPISFRDLAKLIMQRLTKLKVQAVAKAPRLNPRHELNVLLQLLEEKRLIEKTKDGINVLGVTTRETLKHASDFFNDAQPSKIESASIDLAEKTLKTPIAKKDIAECIGDTHELTTRDPDAAGKDDGPGGNGDKCGPLRTFAYFSVEIFHNAGKADKSHHSGGSFP